MRDDRGSAFHDPTSMPPFELVGRLVFPSLNRVKRGEETHQLEPRIMQVLLCLASRPGEVLSREFLFRTVWPDSVVCEDALTRAISELRRVFGDNPHSPYVIETIRKGGYRLIAPVTPNGGPDPGEAPRERAHPGAAAMLSPATGVSGGRLGLALRWTVAAVVATVLLGALLSRSIRTSPPGDHWRVRPLTAYPGMEYTPALSPDGSMVAFSWSGEEGGGETLLDIYLMLTEEGDPVRLTSDPRHELYPAWSPDGTTIAFARGVLDSFEICTVPILGGEVRMLISLPSEVYGLDWSPDGDALAYAAHDGSSTDYRIYLLPLDTLTPRPLLPRHEPGADDVTPVFSPDGREVAFVRMFNYNQHQVYVASRDGTSVRRLPGDAHRISGLDWASGHELLLSSSDILDFDLWLTDLKTGAHTWLTVPGRPAISPTIARDGERVVFGELSYDCQIWKIHVLENGRVRQDPEPFVASTRLDYHPVSSPDGSSLAFISDRSGETELWIAGHDGRNPHRFTDRVGSYLMNPCWSPDGREIAYSAVQGGHMRVFVSDMESRVPRRLSDGDRHELLTHWSRSGRWLYYRVQGPDGWQLWRRHPDQGGEELVMDTGYTPFAEERAGEELLCLKDDEPGVWRIPAGGGDAQRIVSADAARNWISVAAADSGFYFILRGTDHSTLGYYDRSTARADSLGVLPLASGMLHLSRDGSALFYDSTKRYEIDLVLMDRAS